ncbi:methylisocitrate lyase [Coleophoma cylindrospora]|uniref:Methylisocitrate lyase n=1 Tax=Coleophoma cylindrospora TaxID=1849047 RepID=A0A3D8R6Z0_9HELO|nr:methylisocitrate lyase [Coleophoma cylindrospora]
MISPEEMQRGHAEHTSSATKLRHFLANSNEILACPGVHDGFSARIALSVGFSALYMTGAGTTASRLGHADLGIATQSDMRAHAEMIANIDAKVPLIADADTGYGGPIMVARTVEQYARSGVAGMHIEDQVQTKRCGHLGGKELVDLDTFASRIRAAVAARKRIGSDIVIIARTDALQGFGYDEAIRRLKFVRDLGADVGFLEGMTSKEMFRSAVKDLAPWPLLLNMVEGGITPTISIDEAQEIGLRIIIHPLATINPAYQAIKDQLEKLKNTGRMDHDPKLTPQFIFNVCGLRDSMAVDADAGGKSFSVDP